MIRPTRPRAPADNNWEDFHETKTDCGALACHGLAAGVASAQAGNIIDEWANVKAPAAPELKPVTVDNKTDAPTYKTNCTNRPRCGVDPGDEKLLTEARAKGATVV